MELQTVPMLQIECEELQKQLEDIATSGMGGQSGRVGWQEDEAVSHMDPLGQSVLAASSSGVQKHPSSGATPGKLGHFFPHISLHKKPSLQISCGLSQKQVVELVASGKYWHASGR